MRNPIQYIGDVRHIHFHSRGSDTIFASALPGDYQAFQDPQSPINPLIYFGMILGMTVLMLVLIKFAQEKLMRAIFYGAMVISMFSILTPIFLYFDQRR